MALSKIRLFHFFLIPPLRRKLSFTFHFNKLNCICRIHFKLVSLFKVRRPKYRNTTTTKSSRYKSEQKETTYDWSYSGYLQSRTEQYTWHLLWAKCIMAIDNIRVYFLFRTTACQIWMMIMSATLSYFNQIWRVCCFGKKNQEKWVLIIGRLL
jgi:hypothetical protein